MAHFLCHPKKYWTLKFVVGHTANTQNERPDTSTVTRTLRGPFSTVAHSGQIAGLLYLSFFVGKKERKKKNGYHCFFGYFHSHFLFSNWIRKYEFSGEDGVRAPARCDGLTSTSQTSQLADCLGMNQNKNINKFAKPDFIQIELSPSKRTEKKSSRSAVARRAIRKKLNRHQNCLNVYTTIHR